MAYSLEVDKKWQKKWKELGFNTYKKDDSQKKLYVLEMFSCPSGANLHIGHWYNYSLSDSWARMKKMQNYDVFQPMGFDSFGLPAENYAIKTGIHPQDSTLANIKNMEKQLQEMGAIFAWDHELSTCSPEYYKWTQWLFIQLYKHGLAYRKNAPVNWCPSCQTVLANEQVIDGYCERCNSEVTKRNLTQWFFKITDYAQELLDFLPKLDWPEKTKKIQNNWIGRSDGAEIVFHAKKEGKLLLDKDNKPVELKVFTTRADTLMGVTYVVCAPESEWCDTLTTDEERASVKAYIDQTNKTSEIERLATDREKTGVFTGSYAVHPLTGESIPIWTSDYVIASYGTGIVMAVPAHDERDFAFAEKFNLPIVGVIENPNDETILPYCNYGKLVNSGEFDNLSSKEGITQIMAKLNAEDMGSLKINYRLRDWLVSRQRYWGAPIPMIYCDSCGTVPVPEDQLPVLLPYDVEFKPDGKSPLAKSDAFVNTTCPNCNEPAKRDVDTLDTFVCSSWYYLRYVNPHDDTKPFETKAVDQMLPVDKYVGGAEHAAMHLIYARFITKALRDMGYIHFDEPFTSLVHQGVILGADGQKMSKSLGNTIAPDDYINLYGSDVFRVYLAFGFSYIDGGPWNDGGVKAIAKFIQRIEKTIDNCLDLNKDTGYAVKLDLLDKKLDLSESQDKDLNYALHFAIKGVNQDAERFQFNTAISRIMELNNALNKYLEQDKINYDLLNQAVLILLQLFSPFAPHFVEEQWEKYSLTDSVLQSQWPNFSPEALIKDEIEIAIQFNGQVKSRILIPNDADQYLVQELVMKEAIVQQILTDKQLVKFIYVKGRLANLVVK